MGIPSQGLRGLVAQGMDGRKVPFQGYTYQYPPGSYTFSAPVPGRWKFVLWGPGGTGTGNGGGSGGYSEKTVDLAYGQSVALVIGSPGTDTTATFPNGTVVTAGAGVTTTAGTASGGDVNVSGSAAGVAGSGTGGGAAGSGAASSAGGGAPAVLPFRGGRGGNQTYSTAADVATSPGGGGRADGGGINVAGGSGLGIVMLDRR